MDTRFSLTPSKDFKEKAFNATEVSDPRTTPKTLINNMLKGPDDRPAYLQAILSRDAKSLDCELLLSTVNSKKRECSRMLLREYGETLLHHPKASSHLFHVLSGALANQWLEIAHPILIGDAKISFPQEMRSANLLGELVKKAIKKGNEIDLIFLKILLERGIITLNNELIWGSSQNLSPLQYVFMYGQPQVFELFLEHHPKSQGCTTETIIGKLDLSPLHLLTYFSPYRKDERPENLVRFAILLFVWRPDLIIETIRPSFMPVKTVTEFAHDLKAHPQLQNTLASLEIWHKVTKLREKNIEPTAAYPQQIHRAIDNMKVFLSTSPEVRESDYKLEKKSTFLILRQGCNEPYCPLIHFSDLKAIYDLFKKYRDNFGLRIDVSAMLAELKQTPTLPSLPRADHLHPPSASSSSASSSASSQSLPRAGDGVLDLLSASSNACSSTTSPSSIPLPALSEGHSPPASSIPRRHSSPLLELSLMTPAPIPTEPLPPPNQRHPTVAAHS